MEFKVKTSLDKNGSTKLMQRFVFSDTKSGVEGCIWIPQKIKDQKVVIEVSNET